MIDMSHMTHTLQKGMTLVLACSHSSLAASQATLAWRNCNMQCPPLPCCQGGGCGGVVGVVVVGVVWWVWSCGGYGGAGGCGGCGGAGGCAG